MPTSRASETKPLLAIVGNSLSVASAVGNKTVTKINTLTSQSYTYVDLGIGGRTFDLMTVDWPTIGHNRYSKLRSLNILVVWEVRNQIAVVGSTAQQTFDKMKTFCQTAKAQGWKIVAVTVPSSTGYETAIADTNALILADTSGDFDLISNVGGNVNMQDPSQPTYFTDGTHLTSAGYTVAANILGADIASKFF